MFIFIAVGIVVVRSSNESARASAEIIAERSTHETAVRISKNLEAYKQKLDGISIVIQSMKRDTTARGKLERVFKMQKNELFYVKVGAWADIIYQMNHGAKSKIFSRQNVAGKRDALQKITG